MTKIKNTKKGMAKKTLSISLAVAMLATSNVPVWAAEDLFTDGEVAVEAFTAEEAVEAPVVEETKEVEGARSIINEGDISVDLTADKKSVVWSVAANEAYKVNISGSITGTPESGWLYRWVDENGIVAKAGTEKITAVANMSTQFGKETAGKTLTLHVYDVDSNDQTLYDITTDIKVSVEKRELKDFTVNTDNLSYSGFTQSKEEMNVSAIKDAQGGNVSTDDCTVTFTSGIKAGDVLKATVTANADSAYTGTITKEAGKIVKKTANADANIIASTDKEQVYQYTGNDIVIDNAKVALKESLSENNGEDGKLSGADLSKAIVSAKATDKTVGDKTVTVTINPDKLDNISTTTTTFTTEETVKIAKRDLSTAGTKITVNTVSGQIPTSASVKTLANFLSFTGTEGKVLNLTKDVDYSFVVTDSKGDSVTGSFTDGTTYNVVVRAKRENGTCENEQTLSLVATGATLKAVECENGIYKASYTGEEIKPSKDDLGKLKLTYINKQGKEETTIVDTDAYEITDYANNINASTVYANDTNSKLQPVATSAVNVKITSGTYENKTCTLYFLIKPLEVKAEYVSVPENISINKNYTKADEYKVPVTVTAKDADKKIVKTLTADDYTVSYEFETENDLHHKIKTTVTVTNPNYILGTENGKTVKLTDAGKTEIVAKKLTDSMVVVNPSSYTYTGGKITPTYVVMDGNIVLYKHGEVDPNKCEYTEVGISDAVNVGTGKIKVAACTEHDFYSGTATGTFEITPADTSSVKVSIDDQDYTGRQIRPREFTVKLAGNDVTDQFEIVSYGANVEAGKGTVELKPVDRTKNFTGANITAEFNIVKEKVKVTLDAYDSKGFKVTDSYKYVGTTSAPTASFTFDGNEKTFVKTVISNPIKVDGGKTTATVNDFEVKYVDNISGNKVGANLPNRAYAYVVAKEGTGFSGGETIVTADGTVIKGVVAVLPFGIKSVKFVDKNVSIKNGTYAAGLPVKPEILIQIGGNTLVEGKDYKVELVDKNNKAVTPTDVTVGQIYGVKITGINGYTDSSVISKATNGLYWGVDKKNLKDCDIKVVDGIVTVTNGYIPVPSTEYTATSNNDGTYTVTAVASSKHYTGSATVTAEGLVDNKPATPMISTVNVYGNKATAVLSGESDGAMGYDYVISTDRDCITNKDYDKVNKNILTTKTDFTYVQQGTYYAYCHAWTRDENGKKVFSDWSDAYAFVVGAITPETPVVTSVSVKGSTVTVKYTAAENATGYDVVLGTAVKTVAGEKRPVEYGTLVKKNIKGNVVTATFKNVPKGTYYAGLHAFNRTNPKDNTKVFSPWSNTKKVTVK